jgi:hypothetical protein
VDLTDVGTIEGGGGKRLATEALSGEQGGLKLGGQMFDGDPPLQQLIARLHDQPHPACAPSARPAGCGLRAARSERRTAVASAYDPGAPLRRLRMQTATRPRVYVQARQPNHDIAASALVSMTQSQQER